MASANFVICLLGDLELVFEPLSPVHTGDKVEFNTVDFVVSRQSRPCCFGSVHTSNKVDHIGNTVNRDKMSNSSFTSL